MGRAAPPTKSHAGGRRGALGAPVPGLLHRLHRGGRGRDPRRAQRRAGHGPVLARRGHGGGGLRPQVDALEFLRRRFPLRPVARARRRWRLRPYRRCLRSATTPRSRSAGLVVHQGSEAMLWFGRIRTRARRLAMCAAAQYPPRPLPAPSRRPLRPAPEPPLRPCAPAQGWALPTRTAGSSPSDSDRRVMSA